jgi:arylsulfatase A-like enzyme
MIRLDKDLMWAAVALTLLAVVSTGPGCTSSDERARPNVVLVIVDALRPDHLGCYGYDRPTSPVIDALAERGILFETAIAPAPWTKTSFSSFLTSLYPFQHGVVGWESIMPDTIVTLSEILRDNGYATLAVINMLGITDRFGVLKGTDGVSAAAKYKRDAAKATADAIEMMDRAAQPFFIIVHYFDVHWPYRPPVKYVDQVSKGGSVDALSARHPTKRSSVDTPDGDTIERERLLYDACIRFADEGIGKIIDFLEETGIRQETVIIVTADHGEAFWEHGVGSHGHNLYDEAIKVPLILDYPAKYTQPRRIEAQVGLIDLVPTVVSLTGAGDGHHREGRDLTHLIETGVAAADAKAFLPGDLMLSESTLRKSPDTKSIRARDWKIIIEPVTALVELYNLRDDRSEETNLWGRGGAIGDSLLRLIQRVPGSSVNGWRLGFTGQVETAAFRANVRLLEGARLTGLKKGVAGGEATVEIGQDSTYFRIEVRPKRQQVFLFDTEPGDARVMFEIVSDGAGPATVYTGRNATTAVDDAFVLDSGAATGLPEVFDENRRSGSPGVYVWWLRGKAPTGVSESAILTPEEKKRLRALGYIQ